VTEAVLAVLNGEPMPSNFSHMHVVLIPKKQNPTETAHFRSIKLCNMRYKLVTKVITNRLKDIFPSIISKIRVLSPWGT